MLLMLAALLAATPLAEGTPPPARGRPASCAVVEVRSDKARHAGERFRATRILGLEFETRLRGPRKDGRAPQLLVYTPDGFLYQVLETSVLPRHAGRRFAARLPVAGTSIMMSGLYGRWRVVPYAHGGREPCGPARGFEIQP